MLIVPAELSWTYELFSVSPLSQVLFAFTIFYLFVAVFANWVRYTTIKYKLKRVVKTVFRYSLLPPKRDITAQSKSWLVSYARSKSWLIRYTRSKSWLVRYARSKSWLVRYTRSKNWLVRCVRSKTDWSGIHVVWVWNTQIKNAQSNLKCRTSQGAYSHTLVSKKIRMRGRGWHTQILLCERTLHYIQCIAACTAFRI